MRYADDLAIPQGSLFVIAEVIAQLLALAYDL